jgi:hypothetical protein
VKKALYFGDSLDVLREATKEDSVDFDYLDPPFNSSATDNVLFKNRRTGIDRREDGPPIAPYSLPSRKYYKPPSTPPRPASTVNADSQAD